MTTPNAKTESLTADNYKFLQDEVHLRSGIVIDAEKHYLLEARLTPVARQAGIASLNDLCKRLRERAEPMLRQQVMEALTTNETLFFRDMAPFEALQQRLLPEFMKSLPSTQPLKIWSAAASSGQEAYSIAMLLREHYPEGRYAKILGTDISEQILNTARQASYGQFEMNRGLPARYLVKYFERDGVNWQAKDELRNMVTFRQFDLRQPMSGFGSFHIIFCRNVLIYFDAGTKKRILSALHAALTPGGYLLLGGAESISQPADQLERIAVNGTALYRKE